MSISPNLTIETTRPPVARTPVTWPPQMGPGADITALVGNTPLLRLPKVMAHLPQDVEVYAKAEWYNPGGSVKDRPALNIIRAAERCGHLRPGVTLLDSSSGNMGIAYAMLGTALGYDVKLVLPESVSPERLQILRAYGVDLVLSDPTEGTDGAIRLAEQLYRSDPERYFYANQYDNPNNWRAHYKTTGQEIWDQTGGRVTHFVAGLGTSGTMMGVGRRLRACKPGVRLIAVQPDAPFNGLAGLKHMETALVPGIYDRSVHDEVMHVRTEEAYAMCRRLAREDGVLVGVSAGAAMVVALRVAERLAERAEPGVVVTVFPDSAAKYLSQPFWSEKD